MNPTDHHTSHADSPPTGRRRSLVIAVAVVALAALIGGLLGPGHQRLGTPRAGDGALAERITALIGADTGGLDTLAVAEITPAGVTWAGLGDTGTGNAPDLASRYELGSITKTFTGALLALAIERGEVRAQDALADHLPELTGTPAGAVTLGSLAQHSSGLPGLGRTAMGDAVVAQFGNENPYASTTTARLLQDAAAAPVNPGQPATYSNFAVALLGTALTRAAGASDYAALLRERITGPLGMENTVVAARADQIPADALPGAHENGLPAPRWDGEGYLPAGSSTFTTLEDVTRWARSQLTQGPGAAAQQPTAALGKDRIGWAWISSELPPENGHTGRTMVWHNGGTAGFRTMLALDPASGRGVVVLANTGRAMDGLAISLLFDRPLTRTSEPIVVGVAWFVVGLALLLGLAALVTARRATGRLPVINALLGAAFALLLAWHSGPWFAVGGWVWGLALAPALGALVVLVQRWHGLPTLPPRRGWLSLLGVVVNLALVAAVVWMF